MFSDFKVDFKNNKLFNHIRPFQKQIGRTETHLSNTNVISTNHKKK